MTEGQEHLWHIELDYMRAQLRYALDNLDSLSKRNDVKGKIENVYFTLDELCEQTKGDSVHDGFEDRPSATFMSARESAIDEQAEMYDNHDDC